MSNIIYPLHVHVPYWRFDDFAPLVVENRVGIELFIGSHSIDKVNGDRLREIRDTVDAGCSVSLHGPFMDLSPGATDSTISSATFNRFMQTLSYAGILGAGTVVFHSGYDNRNNGGRIEPWLGNSVTMWKRVMGEAENSGIRVAIENVYDSQPDHLLHLAELVNHELFGLCLDVGHREIYSGLPVGAWLDKMQARLFELHLHDNNGGMDEHLPPGEGVVDFAAIFGRMRGLAVTPVCTVEARTPADALAGIRYIDGYLHE